MVSAATPRRRLVRGSGASSPDALGGVPVVRAGGARPQADALCAAAAPTRLLAPAAVIAPPASAKAAAAQNAAG